MSLTALVKTKCPRCGGVNIGKCGFAKDHIRRKWKCIDCGRVFVENPKVNWGKPKVYVPKQKKCIECCEDLTIGYRRKTCEKCLMKKATFCRKCGKQLGESNKSGLCWGCKLEFIEKCKASRYVNLDIQYSKDGCPFCPDCGSLMERCGSGKWECDNEACSVIYLAGKKGAFKVIRDHVMAPMCSGNVMVQEVES